MSRRQKLSRDERSKRRAKRERRASTPKKASTAELKKRLYQAYLLYDDACRFPEGLRGERVVCERCLFEQEHRTSDSEDEVTPCGFCGHEYAVTVESLA